MAFIQQRLRRPLQLSRSQDDCPDASSSTLEDAGPTSSSFISTLPLSSSTTSGPAAATQDWSIVFPGRARANREPYLYAASHSLVPSHDGTGSFGEASGTHSGSNFSQAMTTHQTISRHQSPDLNRHFDAFEEGEGGEAEECLFLEDFTEAGSLSSSSGRPPSIVSSPDESSAFTSRHARAISPQFSSTRSQTSSSSSTGRAEDDIGSPTPSHFSFEDHFGPQPIWSWQQAGETRVLASTTPRQQSPTRITTSSPQALVLYASESEGEQEEEEQQQHQNRPHGYIEDAQFEDAMRVAPFAMSAGLLPRRSARNPSASIGRPPASSVFSGSQVSAGFKRRHRHQHDGESVRSRKSRRSEGPTGMLDAISGGNRTGGRLTPTTSRLSATSARGLQHSHTKTSAFVTDGATVSATPSLSKKGKVTKLLGKLFDVDVDVYDSLMNDEGPLALTTDDARPQNDPWQPRRVGFEYEQTELGADADTSLSGKRWRELIDGRIVEDLEGGDGAAEKSGSLDGGEVREEQRVQGELGNDVDEAALLSRADTSSHCLPSVAIRGVSNPATNELLSQDGIATSSGSMTRGGDSHADSSSGEVNVTLVHFAPDLSAMLTSTAGAITDAMPYFVPFSWRLLMRLMRELRSEGEEAKRELQQQQRVPSRVSGRLLSSGHGTKENDARSVTAKGGMASHPCLDLVSDEGGDVEDIGEEKQEISGDSSARGRSRERKSLYESTASSWSLAATVTSTTWSERISEGEDPVVR